MDGARARVGTVTRLLGPFAQSCRPAPLDTSHAELSYGGRLQELFGHGQAQLSLSHIHTMALPSESSHAALLSTILSPFYSSNGIDTPALAALAFGALLGAIIGILLCGCNCCGYAVVVNWRSCYKVTYSVSAQPRHQARPQLHQSRLPPHLQQRRPLISPLQPRSNEQLPVPARRIGANASAPDAAAWNHLRDALGPDVPDYEIAHLLELHGDNPQGAVQAYFDAQSHRRRC